jgi:hypothetical protein
MLRLFLVIAGGLLIALMGISLGIARAWGWSEYASPELYVVYYQISNPHNQFFVVDASGSGLNAELAGSGGTIAQVDCSPDGRYFAFLTDTHHLYVLNSAGTVSDRAEDPAYTTLSVANDGTAALFDPLDDRLLIGDHALDLSAARPANAFDRVKLSQQGNILWMRNFNDIQIVSSGGSVTPYVPHGYSGNWLASGQIFTYADNMTDPEGVGLYGGQYLMDMRTHLVAKIGDWDLSRPLSPDAVKTAAPLTISGVSTKTQIVVYDLLTNAHLKVLTHDPDTASQPVCFLTFLPKMLIAGN